MRPVRLNLTGFTSFKNETEVDLSNLDRFAICGPTGAGKSSLLDAMTFALFADAPRIARGAKTDLVALGSKSFSVMLDFRVGGTLYRISRVRRRAGSGRDQLERQTGQDAFELVQSGEKAVTRQVEQLLGLNYDHFTQAVFLPQGKFAEFLKSEPAKRRRLLNELLRLLIYDRMRDRAGEARDRCAQAKADIERRLDEDYSDITLALQADLELRLGTEQKVVKEADAQLPGLEEKRDTLRHRRGQTVELQTKQQDRDLLRKQNAEIEEIRHEIEAATRAMGVVPLLDQADQAQKAHAQRLQALEKAVRDRDQCETAYRAAQEELALATQRAAVVPQLRAQLQTLAEAAGKVALRDQLERQLTDKRRQQQTISKEHETALGDLQSLADIIKDLKANLEQASADVAALDYDANRHACLDAVRETAARLQHEREKLPDLRRQAEQEEAAAVEADKAAERSQTDAAAAEEERKQAEQKRLHAERTLRAAEDAHKAAHLREALQIGESCPVCLCTVTELPAAEPAPQLDNRKQELVEANREFDRAHKKCTDRDRAAVAAQTGAKEARSRAGKKRSEANDCSAAHLQQRRSLEESVSDLFGRDEQPIEDRILASVRALTAVREKHRQASERVNAVSSDLALKRQRSQAQEIEVGRLARDLLSLADDIAEQETALASVRGEIREAAGDDDPRERSKHVQSQITVLEHHVAEARRVEAESKNTLSLSTARAETCAREARDAEHKAGDANSGVAEALARAGFEDATGARAAFRAAEQLQRLEERVRDHQGRLLALDNRIAELERELGGRLVSEEAARQAEQAFAELLQRKQAAERQVAILEQRIDDVKKRLAQAEKLRTDLVDLERLHRIHYQLAQDLRIDKFQAFLLEETLTSLVRAASLHLALLTGDRYGLNFVDDRIIVIDHDNAGEFRAIDTLSGGETFLASLALALALSEQVQKAVGAVHLDCLFIDEGFGTLDPETLRIVADAIRSLQVSGRMVGIVTHIPELKEEFDQRLIVEKDGGASQVRVERV